MKVNKIAPFILAAVVALPAVMPSGISSAGFFKDVADDHKFARGINYFYAKNISRGFEDGSFQPDKTVTRAEALKFIYSAENPFKEPKGKANFVDVPSDSWFYPYVGQAVEEGVINDGEKFNPNNPISRVGFLKMLFAVKGIDVSPYEDEAQILNYDDIDKSAWYMPFLYFARGNSIISDTGKNVIGPTDHVTRGEAASIIYRLSLNMTQMRLSAAEARIASVLQMLGEGKLEEAKKKTPEIISLLESAIELVPENPTVRGAHKFAQAINTFIRAELADDEGLQRDLMDKAYQLAIDASLISDNPDVVKVASAMKVRIRDRYYQLMSN